jgi:predicted hydrocarbon binding protein
MTEKAKNSSNVTYEALASMSRLVYEKFGDSAIPIIRDVWYKMGITSGERLKKKLTTVDFRSAANLLAERSNKTGVMEKCQISDNLYHFSTKPGTSCNVGLKDEGCSICEAVMSVNQGQFRSICGCDVEMNIARSRATGADCCEVIFRPVNVKNE